MDAKGVALLLQQGAKRYETFKEAADAMSYLVDAEARLPALREEARALEVSIAALRDTERRLADEFKVGEATQKAAAQKARAHEAMLHGQDVAKYREAIDALQREKDAVVKQVDAAKQDLADARDTHEAQRAKAAADLLALQQEYAAFKARILG